MEHQSTPIDVPRERSLTAPPAPTRNQEQVLISVEGDESSGDDLRTDEESDERHTTPKARLTAIDNEEFGDTDNINEPIRSKDNRSATPTTRAAALMEELAAGQTASIGEVNHLITQMGHLIIDKLYAKLEDGEQAIRKELGTYINQVHEELSSQIVRIISNRAQDEAILLACTTRIDEAARDYKDLRKDYDLLAEDFEALIADIGKSPPRPSRAAQQTPTPKQRSRTIPNAPVKDLGLDPEELTVQENTSRRQQDETQVIQERIVAQQPQTQQRTSCVPDVKAMMQEAMKQQTTTVAPVVETESPELGSELGSVQIPDQGTAPVLRLSE